MKKRIILFALSLAVIVGMLSAGNAYAWFSTAEGGSAVANNLTAGTIAYSLGDGAFLVANQEYVYPEQNLLTGAVSLESDSDIPTCLRVKVTYTYGQDENDNTVTQVATDSSSCPLRLTFTNEGSWHYNSTDGYFHYVSSNNSDAVVPAKTTQTVTIPLFSEICYSGANTDNNTLAGQSVTVKVYYEARQSQYLDSWTYTT